MKITIMKSERWTANYTDEINNSLQISYYML